MNLARRCWEDLDDQRKRLGLSLRKLTQHLESQCPDLGPTGHSTVASWFKKCQSLPDKLVFLELVNALKLDEQEWSERWSEWDRARVAAALGSAESSPNEPEPTALTSHEKRYRSVLLVGIGVLGGTLSTLGVVALSAKAGSSTNPETPSEFHQLPTCANIVTQVAYVFPAPGDESYEKIAKYRGEQVTLYTDKPDIVGPDGRRYRAIRSPARANPGRSPYSWMLADDLAGAPCRSNGRTTN